MSSLTLLSVESKSIYGELWFGMVITHLSDGDKQSKYDGTKANSKQLVYEVSTKHAQNDIGPRI